MTATQQLFCSWMYCGCGRQSSKCDLPAAVGKQLRRGIHNGSNSPRRNCADNNSDAHVQPRRFDAAVCTSPFSAASAVGIPSSHLVIRRAPGVPHRQDAPSQWRFGGAAVDGTAKLGDKIDPGRQFPVVSRARPSSRQPRNQLIDAGNNRLTLPRLLHSTNPRRQSQCSASSVKHAANKALRTLPASSHLSGCNRPRRIAFVTLCS
jgi:hypothetical protein